MIFLFFHFICNFKSTKLLFEKHLERNVIATRIKRMLALLSPRSGAFNIFLFFFTQLLSRPVHRALAGALHFYKADFYIFCLSNYSILILALCYAALALGILQLTK